MTVEKLITVGVNEDLEFGARWTDELGAPYTLVNAYCQVRKAPGTRYEPVLNLSAQPVEGIAITEDQWAIVSVPYVDLADIPPGHYFFDLVLERSGGARLVALEGKIVFQEGVTHV